MQVQGVQNLQNLQLQTSPTQQITLAPVQTLSLGQGGTPVSLTSGQMPNLQSVTVNTVGQAGFQFQQSEDTDSTGGTAAGVSRRLIKMSVVTFSIREKKHVDSCRALWILWNNKIIFLFWRVVIKICEFVYLTIVLLKKNYKKIKAAL